MDDEKVNLKTDPEGQFAEWEIDIAERASRICVKVYGEGGLLNVGIGMTTAAWVLENGDAPRPPGLTTKPTLGASPTVAERDIYKIALEEFYLYTDGTGALKEAILDDFGPALRAATKDAATGHRNRSITFLLDFVHQKYGAVSEINLKKLKALLSTPWSTETDLEAQFEIYKGHHAKLAHLGQPRSQSDRIELFEVVTATLPNVVYYLRRYFESTLNINERTLAGAMTFICAQQVNFTSKTAGWAGAVTHSDADIERRIAAGIKEGIAKAMLHTESAAKPSAKKWCFKHGPGHGGETCRAMLSRPDIFTADFLKATREGTVKGVKSFPAQVHIDTA